MISSPNYPGNYPSNTNCNWTIEVPEGFTVSLQFNDFLIEPTSSCYYDYIKVFDGPNQDGSFLGKYCRTGPLEKISSIGNVMFISMTSDAGLEYSGFNATFSKG